MYVTHYFNLKQHIETTNKTKLHVLLIFINLLIGENYDYIAQCDPNGNTNNLDLLISYKVVMILINLYKNCTKCILFMILFPNYEKI